ncbi:SnodProt1 [Thelephora terrestris]|uniref:SnodProt1 n=1 Tax=Thelephora terrestris TaxID=56493 RepID=A0A9P6HRP3_9AGAM|nr:SnodProt1 [Thelephora terrestris]
MRFISIISLLAAPFVISATRVSWDSVYDQGMQSLATVTCSDGSNGLLTKGYNLFKDLPTFPNIGGFSGVAAWNSPDCGTCWNITYQGETITVTVIDHTDDGFNLSEEAMNTLTDDQAESLGAVDAISVQVDISLCGLA